MPFSSNLEYKTHIGALESRLPFSGLRGLTLLGVDNADDCGSIGADTCILAAAFYFEPSSGACILIGRHSNPAETSWFNKTAAEAAQITLVPENTITDLIVYRETSTKLLQAYSRIDDGTTETLCTTFGPTQPPTLLPTSYPTPAPTFGPTLLPTEFAVDVSGFRVRNVSKHVVLHPQLSSSYMAPFRSRDDMEAFHAAGHGSPHTLVPGHAVHHYASFVACGAIALSYMSAGGFTVYNRDRPICVLAGNLWAEETLPDHLYETVDVTATSYTRVTAPIAPTSAPTMTLLNAIGVSLPVVIVDGVTDAAVLAAVSTTMRTLLEAEFIRVVEISLQFATEDRRRTSSRTVVGSVVTRDPVNESRLHDLGEQQTENAGSADFGRLEVTTSKPTAAPTRAPNNGAPSNAPTWTPSSLPTQFPTSTSPTQFPTSILQGHGFRVHNNTAVLHPQLSPSYMAPFRSRNDMATYHAAGHGSLATLVPGYAVHHYAGPTACAAIALSYMSAGGFTVYNRGNSPICVLVGNLWAEQTRPDHLYETVDLTATSYTRVTAPIAPTSAPTMTLLNAVGVRIPVEIDDGATDAAVLAAVNTTMRTFLQNASIRVVDIRLDFADGNRRRTSSRNVVGSLVTRDPVTETQLRTIGDRTVENTVVAYFSQTELTTSEPTAAPTRAPNNGVPSAAPTWSPFPFPTLLPAATPVSPTPVPQIPTTAESDNSKVVAGIAIGGCVLLVVAAACVWYL